MEIKYLLLSLILAIFPQLSLESTCRVTNCQTCLSGNSNSCMTCRLGYSLNNLKKCVASSCASSYCSYCASNRNYCTRCKLGYFSEGGKCISKCNFFRCSRSSFSNIYNECRCYSCENGYLYHTGN